jgi:hypothetical protein
MTSDVVHSDSEYSRQTSDGSVYPASFFFRFALAKGNFVPAASTEAITVPAGLVIIIHITVDGFCTFYTSCLESGFHCPAICLVNFDNALE